MAPPAVPRRHIEAPSSFRTAADANCRGKFAPLVRRLLTAITLLLLAGLPSQVVAQSNNVRITKLSDVSFGTVTNLETDAVLGQSVCVFANTSSNGYWVTATGSGAGGAYTLSSASGTMGYEVQWSQMSGQSTGVQLIPNAPLSGQTSSARHQTCNSGPPTSASLIIALRSEALSSATAGSYSGTLTLVIGPE